MIDNLEKTIELLKQINKGLSEQLLLINERLEELEIALRGIAPVNVMPQITDSHEDSEKEQSRATTLESEDCESLIDAVSEQVSETTGIPSDIEELETDQESDDYKRVLQEKLETEIYPIGEAIEALCANVYSLYTSDNVIYGNVQTIEEGYKELTAFYAQVFEESSANASNLIYDELIDKISSYSWVNTLLRLGAYARLDVFDCLPIVVDDILQLRDRIEQLYSLYGIGVIIPNLLVDDYDGSRHDYDNDHTLWIEHMCELNPIEYVGKVYDLVQAGYVLSPGTESEERHNPIVYYN